MKTAAEKNGKERLTRLPAVLAAAAAGILFFISLIPVINIALFDYANGDDLVYGAPAHVILMNGGNVWEALKIAVQNTVRVWHEWQGTWAGIFLLSTEPSVWNERSYMIGPLLAVLLLTAAPWYLISTVTGRLFGFKRAEQLTAFFVTDIILFQFMCSFRSGIYWYTAMIIYTLPFALCLLILAWMLRYLADGGGGYIFLSLIAAVIIGGDGYPPAVLMLTLFILLIAGAVCFKKAGKLPGIILPMAAMLVSLGVSAVAPGNQVRGGGRLHMGLSVIIGTIAGAVKQCATFTLETVGRIRVFPLFLIAILFLAFFAFDPEKSRLKPAHPVITVIITVLVASSVHAPEVMVNMTAGDANTVGFSAGVANTYYYTLIMCLAFLMIYLGIYIKSAVIARRPDAKIVDRSWTAFRLELPFTCLVIAFCLLAGRYLIGTSLSYTCSEFIRNGHLADFHAQMQERIEILSDRSVRDAVVPEMNEDQGPLMHMPITGDPGFYSNTATASFYDKDTVISMPRDQYQKTYGSTAQR